MATKKKPATASQAVATIRKARKTLEVRADDANLLRPAPWEQGLYSITSQRRDAYDDISVASQMRPRVAAYVSLVDPEVGMAVAGLLGLGEQAWAERGSQKTPPGDLEIRCLDLANLINERTT